MLQVQVISRWADLEQLQSEWDDLLAAGGIDNLFLSWDYLRCWRQTYGSGFEPRVLVARDGGNRLAGIAPLMIGRGDRSVRRFVSHLSFLGQLCDSPPDYCDFLLRPGCEPEVMEVFSSEILRGFPHEWDLLFLPSICEDSPGMRRLRQHFERQGIPLRTVHHQHAPFIALPASWEDYMASRSKNFRKKHRRYTEHLFRQHRVKLWQAGIDLSLDRSILLLKELNRERWGRLANSFRSEQFELFHRRLADCFHTLGRLSLRFLVVDEEPVAAQYDFVDPKAKRVYGFQGGWKREWADRSVGRILQGLCLETYIGQGYREYDFLAGESEYKYSWSTGARPICDVEVPNPRSAKGRLFGLARALRTSVTPVRAAARAPTCCIALEALGGF